MDFSILLNYCNLIRAAWDQGIVITKKQVHCVYIVMCLTSVIKFNFLFVVQNDQLQVTQCTKKNSVPNQLVDTKEEVKSLGADYVSTVVAC